MRHYFAQHFLLLLLLQVLVMVCLLLLRFGGDNRYSSIYKIGDEGDHFLAVGVVVGYAIIVPSVLVCYLLGASIR